MGSGPYVRLPRQPPEITLIYARNSLGKRRKSYPKCNGPWRGRILQCHHGPVSLRRQTHKTPVEANTRIRVQSRHVSTSLTFIHPEPPETLHSISRILNSVHPELTLNWQFVDGAVSALPTAEWQEKLYRRLATVQQGYQGSGVASPYSTTSSNDRARLPSYSSSSGQPSPVGLVPHMPAYSTQSANRRRRLEPSVTSTVPDSDHSSLHLSKERGMSANWLVLRYD